MYLLARIWHSVAETECGNGRIDGDEKCDDKNNIGLDGCSRCKLDPFFICQMAWRHPDTPSRRGYMVTMLACVCVCVCVILCVCVCVCDFVCVRGNGT